MANLADHGNQVACATCVMSPLCNSRAVAHGAPSPVECRRRIAAGEPFYAAGSARDSVYAVRAGFAQVSLDDGHGTHIVRFLLPGDAAGLDAFAGGAHPSQATALEDCEVCVIPTYRAEVLGRYSEETCNRLRELLARQLADSDTHAVMLAKLTAPQRVARFLLDLSRRWADTCYWSTDFSLPKGRRATGQLLALTTETVSRVLSDFQAKGWVDLPWREVRILEIEKLRAVLAGAPEAKAHQQ